MSGPTQRNAMDAAREAALQMLYALEQGSQDAAQVQTWFLEAHPMPPRAWAQATRLVDASVRHRDQIDALISRHTIGWRLERISRVERGILRLATAELLDESRPTHGMVVQGMLRLAKRYSPPEALDFLHAVLDAVARELDATAARDRGQNHHLIGG
ncbi:MAG: transcription antitermination factor NusB [Terriglobales bacterium]